MQNTANGPGPGRRGANQRSEFNRQLTQERHPQKRRSNQDDHHNSHQSESESGQGPPNQKYARQGRTTTTRYQSDLAQAQPARPSLGFRRLHGLLTSQESSALMVIHRHLDEWDNMMDDKDCLSDDLFIIVVHLFGEKLCDDDVILQMHQVEIVRRSFGSGFAAKLGELPGKLLQGQVSNTATAGQNSAMLHVDHSRTRILRNLHKLFAFVALKLPTTAIDRIHQLLLPIFGAINLCISSSPAGPVRVELEALQDDFKKLISQVGSFAIKNHTKDEPPGPTLHSKPVTFMGIGEEELHAMTPPDDFRQISIIPNYEEITSTEKTFLRPTIVQGAYKNADHYLDVQFRLLREDFVRPLKEGIRDFLANRYDYLSGKKKMPIGNVKMYQSVRIIDVQLVRESLTFTLLLSDDISKRVKWEKSKRLLPGSLLVLSADNFQNVYFAVVNRRDPKELRNGEFGVIWEGAAPELDSQVEYIMIESEVYFEAYSLLGEVCQNVVDVKDEDADEEEVEAAVKDEVEEDEDSDEEVEDVVFNIFGNKLSPLVDSWPQPNQIGLDDAQFAAFRAALTQDFTVIQGPPGTGKTFLGLKIAEVFLQTYRAWQEVGQGPILVVCYTNHALDQFLEGIIEAMKRIDRKKFAALIRVGGRSKSETMAKYSLSRQRMLASQLKKYPWEYWTTKKAAIEKIRNIQNLRAELVGHIAELSHPKGNRSRKFIIDLESLGDTVYNKLKDEFSGLLLNLMKKDEWFGMSDYRFRSNIWNENRLLRAWFTVLDRPDKIDTYPKQNPYKNIRTPSGQLVEVESDEEDFDLDQVVELEHQIPESVHRKVDSRCSRVQPAPLRHLTIRNSSSWIKKNQQSFLRLLFEAYGKGVLQFPPLDPDRFQQYNEAYFVEMLSISQKWAIYFHVIGRAKVLKMAEINSISNQLIEAEKEFRQVEREGDAFLLQRVKVVGMTTTGAAKYNDLIRTMKSKIVIVEEAAEVLEAHIVTCLTEHCQQLILIGDHKQLRPSTAVFELSREYNLNISLFERMLKNNMSCHLLKVQHRMRPEIRDLIDGTIYDDLEDSPSVFTYPQVLGLEKNVFFVAHNHLEESESDSMSKSNSHEAKFLANLCQYLIQQGYSTNQITILTTYTGQLYLLKSAIGAFHNCRGVRVAVVDNYQGEENEIILLSLVRSNEKQQAGFIKTTNRICVALSRAKQGLYISGNLDMLVSASTTWKQIKHKLEARAECGAKLNLKCQIHGAITQVENYKDFAKTPEGGCSQMCDKLLECGHNCKSVCHIHDRNHVEYKCRVRCPKICENGHRCPLLCFQPCVPCPIAMEKTLPCRHVKRLKCSVPVNSITCMEEVERALECDHDATMVCHVDPETYRCQIKVTKTLPCSHEKKYVKCHVDSASILCKELVWKNLIPCGHAQESLCSVAENAVKCETFVNHRFAGCDHEAEVKCGDLKTGNIHCTSPCPVRLECGHACIKTCHLQNDPDHLEYECQKECRRICLDGHTCSTRHKCFQKCPPCRQITEGTLLCGHPYKKRCFQPCQPCMVLVKKEAPCGHSQKALCSQPALTDKCLELVKPLVGSKCNHDILVPCKLQATILPQDAVKYCRQKCNYSFSSETEGGCGHTCTGTCLGCHQGRLHQKCQEKCGKTLVCGHICSFPCAKTCPPCRQRCELKCNHSKCNKRCGEPCILCNENCSWECQHKKCTKLCREPCDRTPCEEPCPKTLVCGHSCAGFCGEPCPTLCRVCDKDELTEIFFGNESDEDARFLCLEDCKHCFEVEGMDTYMRHSLEAKSIQAKVCPRCKTIIRHSQRYGDLLRHQLKDVADVKKKLFGNTELVQKKQENVVLELSQNKFTWEITLPAVWKFIMAKIAYIIPAAKPGSYRAHCSSIGVGMERIVPKKVDELTMANIELITNHGKDVLQLIHETDTKSVFELNDDLRTELTHRYQDLFDLLLKRELPLSATEVRDFDREFERLFDLKQAYLRRSFERFTNRHSVAGPLYDRAIEILLAPEVYTSEMKTRLQGLLKEIDESLKTGLGISDRERREILSAIGLNSGRWFKCPNGHVYVITECGGATHESKCNECGARIGGGNHTLRRDNDLASEMDGSTEPLYHTMLQR